MGLHIIPKILKYKVSLDSYPPQTYWETEKFESFDSIRCSGDTDFIYNSNLDWIYEHDDSNNIDYEHSFRRPKNIEVAIEWVKNNTPKSNIDRLLSLLNDLDKNGNIWLVISH